MDGGLGMIQKLELTMAQAMALSQLAERGPMTFAQLQKAASRSQAATSHLVEQLEQRGLVQRKPDPSDGRRRLVELAPGGRRAMERIEQMRRGAMESVFRRLPPELLARFDEVLGEVLSALEP